MKRIIKIIVGVLVLLLAAGCHNLAVMVATGPSPSAMKDKISAQLNDEGLVTLDWSAIEGSSSASFQIYLSKEALTEADLGLSASDPSLAPLMRSFAIRDYANSPLAVGERLAEVSGATYAYSETLDPAYRYIFQIVENSQAKARREAYVMDLRLAFAGIEGLSAVKDGSKIKISWNAVAGASAYDICLDKDGGRILSSSSEANVQLDQYAIDYWVRPKRGRNLGAFSKVSLSQSNAAISKLSAVAGDGLFGPGAVLDFKVTFTDSVTAGATSSLNFPLDQGTAKASYLSGNGSKELIYRYSVQTGDNIILLAAPAVLGGTISDALGLSVSGTLPDNGAFFAQAQNLSIDTSAPTAPTSIGFASATSYDGAIAVSWGASSDRNLENYSVKLCAASDCTTSCGTSSAVTAAAHSYTGLSQGSYYACVKAKDKVELESAWASSTNPVTVNLTPPSVVSLSSAETNGYYTAAQTLQISVTFDGPVTVSGTPALALNSGGVANYASGSGTNQLIFSYLVAATQNASDLDAANANALSLPGGATIKDGVNRDATLTLPGSGQNKTLAEQKALVIDTTLPADPSGAAFSAALFNSTTMNVSWTAGTDANFKQSRLKLCTANDCTNGCLAESSAAASPSTLSGVNTGVYYVCVQSEDQVGLLSNWVASATTSTIDTTAPTVTAVDATTVDGTYPVSTALTLTVTFSEAVTVTGTPTLQLQLGSVQPNATLTGGSGTNTLTFSLTTAAGHNTSDLDYVSTSSLAGTIKDAAGNDANLSLPGPGAANSLGANAAIVIDALVPTVTSISSSATNGSYGPGNTIPVTITFSRVVNVTGGAPTLDLNTTPADTADYVSGSGTTTLTFNFVIPGGTTAADLNFASTTALALGGATILDNVGNPAVLTLPATNHASNSLGGSKDIVIAGNNVAPNLNASAATTNAFVQIAITAVNVNDGVDDLDGDNEAITYSCVFDTNLDNAITAGAANCSTLPADSVSFNASTGSLAWTPSTAASTSLTARTSYEFHVTGTDGSHLSDVEEFVVHVIQPDTKLWSFALNSANQFTYDSNVIEFAGGFAQLKAADHTDDANDAGGFQGAYKQGVAWDSTNNVLRLGDANDCNGNTKNCLYLNEDWSLTEELGLVHYLEFDGDFDDWWNGAAVTTSGINPSFSSDAKVGNNSAVFTGPEAEASPPHTEIQFPTYIEDDLSVMFWVKTTQTVTTGACIHFADGAGLVGTETPGYVNDWQISLCDGYILAGTGRGALNDDFTIKSNSKVNDGKWHHVAFTRERSSGTLKLYIDYMYEKIGTSAAHNTALVDGTPIVIGRYKAAGKGFIGQIDSVSIWENVIPHDQIMNVVKKQSPARAGLISSRIMESAQSLPWQSLSWRSPTPFGKQIPAKNGASIPAEATSEYSGISYDTPLGTMLIANYHLDEENLGLVTGGKDIENSADTGMHGTLIKDSGTGFYIAGPGRLNYSLELNSWEGGSVDLGNTSATDMGRTDFTVSAWVKFTSFANNSARVYNNGFWGSADGFGLFAGIENGGKVGFGIGCDNQGPSNCTMIRTTEAFNDNQWHFIVGVADFTNNRMRMYVDGKRKTIESDARGTCGTLADANTTMNVAACTLLDGDHSDNTRIGRHATGDRYNGLLDEISHWHRAVSEGDIYKLYRRGAQRIEFIVESCANATCSNTTYAGPDGTAKSLFGESHSLSAGKVHELHPTVTFADYTPPANARYLRYMTFFYADDANNDCSYGNCSPELQSVSLGPNHYDHNTPVIVSPSRSLFSLSNFVETSACTAGIKYQVSIDGSNWFYYSGAAWVASNSSYAQANTAAEINTNAAAFTSVSGLGTLYLKIHLPSNGLTSCSIDQIDIDTNEQY